MLAHVGEEADVDAAAQVHLVGDAALAHDQLLGRRLAQDVILRALGRVARALEPHLEDGAAQRQPGLGQHLQRACASSRACLSEPARERRHDRERTVDVGGQPRQPVALGVDQPVGRLAVGQPQRPPERQRGAACARKKAASSARTPRRATTSHELVLGIGDSRRARQPARIDQAHRPAGLELARLHVGERELGRPRAEAQLAGGCEGQAEERHRHHRAGRRLAAARASPHPSRSGGQSPPSLALQSIFAGPRSRLGVRSRDRGEPRWSPWGRRRGSGRPPAGRGRRSSSGSPAPRSGPRCAGSRRR